LRNGYQWHACKYFVSWPKIRQVQASVQRCQVNDRKTPGERVVRQADVKMYDVELLGVADELLEHDEVGRQVLAAAGEA
jgi:hypothetical protein